MVQAMAPDDFAGGFEGKTALFTYKVVEEKKVLGVANCLWDKKADLPDYKVEGMPIPRENWEVRDAWVIEIKSNDSNYPQSLKRIYLDKETYCILATDMYDRAGKPWKFAQSYYKRITLPGGDEMSQLWMVFLVDTQVGFASIASLVEMKTNVEVLKYSDTMPSSLRKAGR